MVPEKAMVPGSNPASLTLDKTVRTGRVTVDTAKLREPVHLQTKK